MNNKQLEKSNGGRDVVPADNTEEFVVPGMENVQPGELKVPLLKLVQGTSRIDGAADHLGEWHNSVTGEFETNPELLIIGIAKGRVMFPATYSADNKPLCGSNDGFAPREEYRGAEIKAVSQDEHGDPVVVSVTIPLACAECPFSQWGENTPPRCKEVATFAGMQHEGMPALIQVMSTGMKHVSSLKTMIAANGIRKTIRLSSVQEKNETGVYYVPVFLLGGKPDKEWQATAMRLAHLGNLAARNQQAIVEYENRQGDMTGEPPEDDNAPWPSDQEAFENQFEENNIPF